MHVGYKFEITQIFKRVSESMKKEKGFTLVESIVALFIGSLMLMAIYAAVNSSQSSASKVERRVSAQQDARGALDLMAMEIQMASYNPGLDDHIWRNPADCTSASAHSTYKGIQIATANSITVEMDINDSGFINTTNNDNETIKYVYDSTNQYITRSTNCGGDQPFLGSTDANSKTVLVVNNTAGTGGTAIPVFRYYNGTGTDISNTVVSSPADAILGIPAIRRIEITLVVDTSSSDQGTSAKRRIIYSTSVIIRNHIPVSPTY
jgi:prepilin-type N-terminal cleavage/methylation domain-containing protein